MGVYFSESSSVVLRHAIPTVGSRDATVIAVHVVDKSSEHYRETSGVKGPGFEILKSQADDQFAELLSGKANGVHVEFIVKSGKPAEELSRIAKDMEASLMVGSANDLTKKRLGLIASRCVRTAP